MSLRKHRLAFAGMLPNCAPSLALFTPLAPLLGVWLACLAGYYVLEENVFETYWCVSDTLQAAAVNGDAGDELAVGPGHKRRKRAWEEDENADEENGQDEEEAKRLAEEKDQREKEEFVERLRQKDEARTRKIAEAKLSKEELQVRKSTTAL